VTFYLSFTTARRSLGANYHDACVKRVCFDRVHCLRIDVAREQTFATPHHNRGDKEPLLVDKLPAYQQLYQRGAADHAVLLPALARQSSIDW
jgi:hypothetical protein